MFQINIHVNANGKLEVERSPVPISVFKESNRVRLNFTIDKDIDSTYHYLKFTHAKTSYLYRLHENYFDIPKAITAWEGLWQFSFICCDEVANSNNTITARYIYASEPVEAVVVKGNLGENSSTEEQSLLKEITEGTFTTLTIPTSADYICPYFMASQLNTYDLFIALNVKTIKDHAFYEAKLNSVKFEEGSLLQTLEDYAFYRITNLKEIVFPRNVANYGKYVLSKSPIEKISFENGSFLFIIGNYSFWDMPNLKYLYLPDRLRSFTGNTAAIKNCPELIEISFPNTMNTSIPQSAIAECPKVQKITLGSNFNCSANFSNITTLNPDGMVAMFRSLKDLTGAGSKVLVLGATNLARLTEEQKAIAINKNWSLS